MALEQSRLGELPGSMLPTQPSLEATPSWLESSSRLITARPVRSSRLNWPKQAPRIGEALFFVALPWFLLTGGGTQGLIWLLLAYGLPRLGSLLLGGRLIEAGSRDDLRMMTGTLRAVAGVALVLVLVGGHPTFWLLCVLAACIGVTFPAHGSEEISVERNPIGV
ncbi:MAG TPA: hypothetical protein VFB60_17500 [Ktedonobacteraceae bacterium]|nr:hypothetical protein [Ktedonobacteraceae bacterium]